MILYFIIVMVYSGLLKTIKMNDFYYRINFKIARKKSDASYILVDLFYLKAGFLQFFKFDGLVRYAT